MSARRNLIIGRAFAIGTALAYGVIAVMIRQGLADLTSPLAGATVALLSGTIILGVMSLGNPEPNLRQKKRSVMFFLIAGVAAALGIVSSFFAFSMAPVVIVSPIQSTNPLFALLGSYLFIGHLERITSRVVLATAIVVAGITLITIGRAL